MSNRNNAVATDIVNNAVELRAYAERVTEYLDASVDSPTIANLVSGIIKSIGRLYLTYQDVPLCDITVEISDVGAPLELLRCAIIGMDGCEDGSKSRQELYIRCYTEADEVGLKVLVKSNDREILYPFTIMPIAFSHGRYLRYRALADLPLARAANSFLTNLSATCEEYDAENDSDYFDLIVYEAVLDTVATLVKDAGRISMQIDHGESFGNNTTNGVECSGELYCIGEKQPIIGFNFRINDFCYQSNVYPSES